MAVLHDAVAEANMILLSHTHTHKTPTTLLVEADHGRSVAANENLPWTHVQGLHMAMPSLEAEMQRRGGGRRAGFEDWADLAHTVDWRGTSALQWQLARPVFFCRGPLAVSDVPRRTY